MDYFMANFIYMQMVFFSAVAFTITIGSPMRFRNVLCIGILALIMIWAGGVQTGNSYIYEGSVGFTVPSMGVDLRADIKNGIYAVDRTLYSSIRDIVRDYTVNDKYKFYFSALAWLCAMGIVYNLGRIVYCCFFLKPRNEAKPRFRNLIKLAYLKEIGFRWFKGLHIKTQVYVIAAMIAIIMILAFLI